MRGEGGVAGSQPMSTVAHRSPNWRSNSIFNLHRKKSFSIFPSPAGMSLTKLSMGGNNDVIYKLFPPRESLVSDITAADGDIEKHFFRCMIRTHGIVATVVLANQPL
jgi:hypothetical protein